MDELEGVGKPDSFSIVFTTTLLRASDLDLQARARFIPEAADLPFRGPHLFAGRQQPLADGERVRPKPLF